MGVWRDERKAYYEEKLWHNQNDPRRMWTVLKQVYKPREKPKRMIKFGEEVLSEGQTVAERLNGFFINSVSTIVENIPYRSVVVEARDVRRVNGFCYVSKEEVRVILNGMRETMGADGISVQMLREIWETVGDRLTEMVNWFLRHKKMPKTLKEAVITPLPKKQNSIRCEDMRPVNNLSVVEKIIVTVVFNLLLTHLKENCLLSECQSGFREKHSTEAALCFVIEEWKRVIDDGDMCVALFLDLRRAFETVDRVILLKKLKN